MAAAAHTAAKAFLRDIRPAQEQGFEVRFETPPWLDQQALSGSTKMTVAVGQPGEDLAPPDIPRRSDERGGDA